MKKIRLIDHNLSQQGGHNYTNATTLLDAQPNIEIWSQATLVDHDPRFIPTFNYSIHHPKFKMPRRKKSRIVFFVSGFTQLLKYNRQYYKDIKRVMRNANNELWLACDADARTLYALLFFGIKHEKELAILAYGHQGQHHIFTLPLFFLIKLFRVKNLHMAFADQKMCANYEQRYKIKCHHIFYPTPLPMLSNKTVTTKVNAVFLGATRKEKGLDILIAAIPQLAELLIQNQLQLGIQIFGSNKHNVSEALDQLTSYASQYPNIQLWEKSFTDNEYQTTLNEADIIILPHRRLSYGARSSGISIEAIASGKPMLATSGTSFAEIAAEHGVVRTFQDGDSNSLATELIKMSRQCEQLSEEAYIKAKEWRINVSPENYWEEVHKICTLEKDN